MSELRSDQAARDAEPPRGQPSPPVRTGRAVAILWLVLLVPFGLAFAVLTVMATGLLLTHPGEWRDTAGFFVLSVGMTVFHVFAIRKCVLRLRGPRQNG